MRFRAAAARSTNSCQHVRAGRLDLASLVGPVYPLDAVDEAVRFSISGSPGRVLVMPG